MSKLSLHISFPGDHGTLGEQLKEAYDAGSPFGGIYSLNGNLGDMAQYVKFWVYRRQTETFNRLPNDFFQGDPVESATRWLTVTKDSTDRNRTQIENWALNPATYFDPLNEPAIELADPNDAAQVAEMIRRAQWLNTWMLTALEIAHQNGFKLAMFSFPTESPPIQAWTYLVPSLRLGKQYGAVLSIHAYGGACEGDSGRLSDKPSSYLRYRDIWAALPEDARLPVIISEAGADNGFDTGEASTGKSFVDDLAICDVEWMKDENLLSANAFQLGGESNMASILEYYGDYISEHPTPAIIQIEPVSDLERRVASLEERMMSNEAVDAAMIDAIRALDTRVSALESPPPTPVNATGIDVSHYQHLQAPIDWTKVKATGKSFVFVKATQSNDITDSTFAADWAGAKAVGLYRGAYHFYRFGVDPVAQANLFLSVLGNDLGELPPVVDVEDTKVATADPNELKRFIDTVQARTNRKPIIYTGSWYWRPERWGGTVAWASSYDLWDAWYIDPPVVPPDEWKTVGWKFWQHSSTGTVDGITGDVDLDQFNGTLADLKQYVAQVPAPPSPIPAYEIYGLSSGTQAEIPQSHADIYGTAFGTDAHTGFKFLTLPDADLMTRSINRIRAKNPNAFLMARLFFSVNTGVKFTPSEFVAYCNVGTSAAYAAGIRDFELFNEPNVEGYPTNWADGTYYGYWLKTTLGILAPRYPDARWWGGSLSPNDGAPKFMQDMVSTGVGDLLYGYCFHSYWQSETGGTWNMTDETGGLSWKKVWRVLPAKEQAKPKSISEFSNNLSNVPPATKGSQYRRYRELLRQNGVHSAFSFVLYWDGDSNHENWANLNGSSTGILAGYLNP